MIRFWRTTGQRRHDFEIEKAGALGEFNRLLPGRPPGREGEIRRSNSGLARNAVQEELVARVGSGIRPGVPRKTSLTELVSGPRIVSHLPKWFLGATRKGVFKWLHSLQVSMLQSWAEE